MGAGPHYLVETSPWTLFAPSRTWFASHTLSADWVTLRLDGARAPPNWQSLPTAAWVHVYLQTDKNLVRSHCY